jgi:hypothetical protein
MAERIFVADGSAMSRTPLQAEVRARKLVEVRAYMYYGWEYTGWGTAPVGSKFRDHGYTGFYFDRVDDGSGPGFGAEAVLERLASGMHWGTRCDGADMFQVDDGDDPTRDIVQVFVTVTGGRTAEDVATALHNLVAGLESAEDVETVGILSVDAVHPDGPVDAGISETFGGTF